MNKDALKGHSDLIILSILSTHPMHGYALSEALKRNTHGMFKFGVGMLYPMLHKLEKKGFIKGAWHTLAGADKKVYSLTRKGNKQLAKRKEDWQAFASNISSLVQKPV